MAEATDDAKKPEPKPEAKPEAKPEPKLEPKPEPKPEAKPEPKPEPQSRVGRFIQSYHTFLSTFVIGAAGLIATSIWQYRQSEMSRHQAESQLQIAKTQADNQWRIERAEILSKNLQVLAARGEASVDQRYGVLLSLTRGDLLDPELGVSYALELGRDNPEYMKSVLASTPNKDYVQLAHAFTPTCEQRYGLARQVDLCKGDAMAGRSDAIARLVSEEAEAWVLAPPEGPDAGVAKLPNPLTVLRDERQVQKEPMRMVWLFAPCITGLAQRKQWAELRRFEAFSDGARLVVALVMSTTHNSGVQSTSGSGGGKGKRRAERREWLATYLLGRNCDDDCRARFAEVMLTGLDEARGDFDDVLKRVLLLPAAESDAAVERLHTRLVRCQVDPSDVVALRDRVVVPTLIEVLNSKPKPDPDILDNLIDLMSPVPEPTEPPLLAQWTLIIARLQKSFPEKYRKGYLAGRSTAEEERRSPPPSVRKVSFCRAADAPVDLGQTTE